MGKPISTDAEIALQMIFRDPETNEPLMIVSRIQNNPDASYSFEVANHNNTRRWRHTIKTEEV